MTRDPKFAVKQTVYKHTGNYGGPGIVRGIANDDGQPLRYLVGHTIQGGFGEFYHVYAEGNLREIDVAVIDTYAGARGVTGTTAGTEHPDGVTGTMGVSCPGAVGVPTPDAELEKRCLEFLLNDNKKARSTVIAASEFAAFVTQEIERAMQGGEPSPAVQRAMAHYHKKVAEYETTELLDALATAHRQVDMLMALVITLDKSFMPSQSSLWPDIVKRVDLIRKYEGIVEPKDW